MDLWNLLTVLRAEELNVSTAVGDIWFKLTPILSAAFGIGGILLGTWLASRNQRKAWLRERQLEVVTQLLSTSALAVYRMAERSDDHMTHMFEFRSARDAARLVGPYELYQKADQLFDQIVLGLQQYDHDDDFDLKKFLDEYQEAMSAVAYLGQDLLGTKEPKLLRRV